MLTPDEEVAVDLAARSGNSGAALEIMRYLAQVGRPGDIANVIGRYSGQLQINRGPARAFLAGRVPAILSNHYLPTAAWAHSSPGAHPAAQEFFSYTIDSPDWWRPLEDAAAACDADRLFREVAGVILQLQTRAIQRTRTGP